MDQANNGKGALLSGVAFFAVLTGLFLLAFYYLSPADPAFGDGAGSSDACSNTDFTTTEGSSQSVTINAPEGQIITGICIKTGVDVGHTGLVTGDVACYDVVGIGTDEVTVTAVGDCQDISHIDYNTEVANTPTSTSVPATATNTSIPATATNTAIAATATNTAIAATATNTAIAATATNTPVDATATNTPGIETNTPVSQTVEPTQTSVPGATQTSVPGATETSVPAATATNTPVVSGVQGGADVGQVPQVQQPQAEVAGVVQQPQAQVGGVTRLPSTGDGAAEANGWLLPLGMALVALGGIFFVASRRLAR